MSSAFSAGGNHSVPTQEVADHQNQTGKQNEFHDTHSWNDMGPQDPNGLSAGPIPEELLSEDLEMCLFLPEGLEVCLFSSEIGSRGAIPGEAPAAAVLTPH